MVVLWHRLISGRPRGGTILRVTAARIYPMQSFTSLLPLLRHGLLRHLT